MTLREVTYKDPNLLIGTRWMFNTDGLDGIPHHVEVVHVESKGFWRKSWWAHVATCYSTPFQYWILPFAILMAEPGAFGYLGRKDEFEWVRTGASVVSTFEPEVDASWWVIDRLGSNVVHLGYDALQEEDSTPPASLVRVQAIQWAIFQAQYRHVSMTAYRERQQRRQQRLDHERQQRLDHERQQRLERAEKQLVTPRSQRPFREHLEMSFEDE